MYKPVAIVVAACLAVFGAASLAGAAGQTSSTKHNAVSVIAVLGPKVNVPPGQFVKAYATCPKGYYVTGGGSYGGAITEVVSGPTHDLRSWFVDGVNYDVAKHTFFHRADAVCVRGSSAVPIGTAAASDAQVHQAELEYLAGHTLP